MAVIATVVLVMSISVYSLASVLPPSLPFPDLLVLHCLVTHLVWLFAAPWTAVHQASLSFTMSWSLLKLVSTESVIPSNHLVLLPPLLLPSIFPSIRVFSSDLALCISGQSIGASASASVLPMNSQVWFLLGWTGVISLQSKGLSRVFSSITVEKHQFFCAQPSLWSNSHIHTWPLKNHSFDYTDLCWETSVP